MVSGFKGVEENHKSAIIVGRKGHFVVGHFIGCSVCHLHGLVGNRTLVPPKHGISQNCSMKNLKADSLWIEHGLRIQMTSRNHKCGIIGERVILVEDSSLVALELTCMFWWGTRPSSQQKHATNRQAWSFQRLAGTACGCQSRSLRQQLLQTDEVLISARPL